MKIPNSKIFFFIKGYEMYLEKKRLLNKNEKYMVLKKKSNKKR